MLSSTNENKRNWDEYEKSYDKFMKELYESDKQKHLKADKEAEEKVKERLKVVVSNILELYKKWDNIKSRLNNNSNSTLLFKTEVQNWEKQLEKVRHEIDKILNLFKQWKEAEDSYNETPDGRPFMLTISLVERFKMEKLKKIVPEINEWLIGVETRWNEIKNKQTIGGKKSTKKRKPKRNTKKRKVKQLKKNKSKRIR